MIDRLPRIPYPPGTEENHFDNESNLHTVTRLETKLAANRQSMHLLRKQIAKEEQSLKTDKDELHQLNENSSRNEISQRELVRTLHALARTDDEERTNVDILDLELSAKQKGDSGLAVLYEDIDIAPILTQLHHHLDSIDQNVAAIRSVAEHAQKAIHELVIYDSTSPVASANSIYLIEPGTRDQG